MQDIILNNSIVLCFSEANPPSLQHLVTFSAVKKIAESIKSDYAIVIAKTRDVNNPLSLSQKLEYINLLYPGFNVVGGASSMRNVQDVVEQYQKRYENVIVAQSADEIRESTTNGVSYGLHNPDYSATHSRMINAVNAGDFTSFKRCLLVHSRDIDARRMFNDIREAYGMPAIKEQIVFSTSSIREQYVAGSVFLLDSFVESDSCVFKVINRNSNYLTVSDRNGILSKKWLTACQPIHISESEQHEFEGITEMKFSSSDKIKVAKIIGGMLGADVDKGSNPEQLVNAGLRVTRTKTLNAEAIAILQKMLKTADDAGIAYDQKLVPKLVKDKKTGEEYDPEQKFDELLNHPDTKTQFKRMKDENGKGWPISKAHEQNESIEQDTSDFRTITDPITGKLRKSRARKVTFDTKRSEVSGEVSESTYHHIVATVTDPNHADISMRAKKVSKNIRIPITDGNVNDAMKRAKEHYVKRGFRVHDVKHVNLTEDMNTDADDIRAQVEKSHLQGIRFTSDDDVQQYIADAHHAHLNTLGGPHVALPIGNSLGGGDDQLIRRKVIYKTESYGESQYNVSDEDGDPGEMSDSEIDGDPGEMSDSEIDDMIAHIDDWDDIIDLYDSSELSYIDANTGEHVGEVEDTYHGPEGDPDNDVFDSEPLVAEPAGTGDQLPTRKIAESAPINEILSRMERIKAKVRFHRTLAKRERSIKIALKRRSTPQKINHRARALAIKTLKLKIAKKPLNTLSLQEKERIERIIQKRKSVINRIAMRLVPRVRKIEQTRLTHPTFTK